MAVAMNGMPSSPGWFLSDPVNKYLLLVKIQFLGNGGTEIGHWVVYVNCPGTGAVYVLDSLNKAQLDNEEVTGPEQFGQRCRIGRIKFISPFEETSKSTERA